MQGSWPTAMNGLLQFSRPDCNQSGEPIQEALAEALADYPGEEAVKSE
jgi:hypothetical protein